MICKTLYQNTRDKNMILSAIFGVLAAIWVLLVYILIRLYSIEGNYEPIKRDNKDSQDTN